jgi:hypothetical protein
MDLTTPSGEPSMPPVQQRQYFSPTLAINGTSLLRFSGFVDPFGANGLLNVIDSFEIEVALSAVTVADAAVEGEDLWKLINALWLREVDGFERYQGIRGDAHRMHCYDVMGADRVPEYADLGIAAAQVKTYRFPVPLEKRFYRRPKAFSLAAQQFKEIVIGGPDVSADSLGEGTPTVSALAGNIRIIANVHEEDAGEVKLRDQVAVHAFPALTGLLLKQQGKLHGLTLFAPGESGGKDLSSTFTSIQAPPRVVPEVTAVADLVATYLRARGTQNNLASTDGGMVRNDPVAAGRAIPVIHTTEDSSSFDGENIDEQQLKTVMSQTGMLAVARTIAPESPQIVAKVAQASGAALSEKRAKTLSKGRNSRQNLANNPFIEKSFPLRRRGLTR